MPLSANDKLKYEALERRRQKHFGRLSLIYELGKKCNEQIQAKLQPNTTDTDAFISRFRRVEDEYRAYDHIHDEMEDLSARLEEDQRLDISNPYLQYENMYFAVQSWARTWNIGTGSNPQVPTTPAVSPAPSTSQFRLPKIEIEPFDGDIDKWPNFYALFTTLVHNNKTYSKIEKFTHLRSLLRSHALSLVQTLTISSNNYTIALQTLVDRFQSVRLLGANSVEKLLSLKPIVTITHANLVTFLDIFSTNINALKGLGIQDLFDFFVMQLGLKTLPECLRIEFENKYSRKEVPNFSDLVKFIQEQVRILELSPDKGKNIDKLSKNKQVNDRKPKTYQTRTALMSMATDTKQDVGKCPKCGGSHKLFFCTEFKKSPVSDRYNFVKANSLCFNCLGFHHKSNCRSSSVCGDCKKTNKISYHHSLLHFPTPTNNNQRRSENIPATYSPQFPISTHQVDATSSQSPQTLACSVDPVHKQRGIMLYTAIIRINDRDGIPRPVKAILDSASQVSIISEACVQKLGLVRRHSSLSVTGVANQSVPPGRGTVGCKISSTRGKPLQLYTDALIMSQISTPQPNFFVNENIHQRFKALPLADPLFHKRSNIEFLLGADLFANVFSDPCEIMKGQPTAINTIFGWVIGGPIPIDTNMSVAPTTLLTCCEQLDCSIKRFWEVEEVSISPPEDPDNVFCEKHFVETHTRNAHGRYSVSLPFTSTNFTLPNTRNHALKGFLNLEKRLKRQPAVYDEYRNYMNEYIQSGHMTLAHVSADYIIPHHCVIKESSTTTRVRPVFNASFRGDSNSCSLNDVLLSGPKLQKDICDVICAFRLGEVVVCCDLRQMYRQVDVHVDVRRFQHIFYRPTIDAEIQEYELTTLVFGIKPSAFLAQRVLQQLVEDEGMKYPLASDTILNQTFVDNICQSVDSIDTAIALQNELITLFNLGGFSLRKWASDRQEVLDAVPVDHREHPMVIDDNDDEQCIKILGLQYEPAGDLFSYVINPGEIINSKRGLLSQVARIYDPLGWLSPVVFFAKNLIQQTWLKGLDWDDPLPVEIRQPWERFHRTLSSLEKIKIKRHTPLNLKMSCQLIGFCDASSLGYAASIFARTENDGVVNVHLIKAKSRLAPLKTISIPRLELCGAVLLTRLLESIAPFRHKVEISSVHLFTDSSTALSWIRTPPHKLKTFVSNRVVQILEHTHPGQWAHVPSKENPSDCASRGLLPNEIVEFGLWWKGPPFIYEPINTWSCLPIEPCEEEIGAELKKEVGKVQTLQVLTEIPTLIIIMERVSSLSILQRAIARILRYARNFRARKRGKCSQIARSLTPIELNDALLICVRVTQQFYYAREFVLLNENKPVSPSLMKLAPFVDERGFLRVGGRLRHSNLPYRTKHPMILPRQSRLATLICDYYHKITLHGGQRMVQSMIQRKFWILSIRQLLRQRIYKCLQCYKLSAKPIEPQMSDLPMVRIQEARAFLNTGIDYAGPFTIKESQRRKAPQTKGYMVLFVCLATKAIHLEFASNLSTPIFLASLDRFIARRGLCSQIFSDCGTNFKGAANHFHAVSTFLRSANADIADHLASRNIKWTFITPAAPHQGGIWESGVKSAKHHLTRILGPLVLTFEEMTTILARIEAVLNSRPLGAMSDDPNDDTDYLTPGHFLIGAPLLSPPEIQYEEPMRNLRDRYQILQSASRCFWKRWSKDYLQTLIPREKWTHPRPNLKIDDVVYIKTPNTTPLHWPIGRVVDIYPGKDGVVRNVKLRTSSGHLVRPAQKLVPLPSVDFQDANPSQSQ